MRPHSVRFESVCPRDIESLVCEELAVSSAFRAWVLEMLALEADTATLISARDSIGDDTADSDRPRQRVGIECGLEVDGERLLVVFAAVFDTEVPLLRSDDRLERYRTRRERALEKERDDCRLVLLAPAGAFEGGESGVSTFDATIALESLREYFVDRGTDRGEYRAALVAAAIDDSRRGTDALVREYRSAVSDREPAFECSLERSPPNIVDDTAAVELEAPPLAPDHRLVHGLRGGTVDLLIPGAAPHIQPFAARYAGVIPPATAFLECGETLVLRQSVPAVEPDVSSLDEAVDAALEAAREHLAVSERVQERTG